MGGADIKGTGCERRKAISKFPQKERDRVKGENFPCGLRGLAKVIRSVSLRRVVVSRAIGYEGV